MVLLVICAILIALTILELFLSETVSGRLVTSNALMYTFIGGVVSFVLALIALLIEVLLSFHTVRMKPISKKLYKCKKMKKLISTLTGTFMNFRIGCQRCIFR
jgi:hypothetical protein